MRPFYEQAVSNLDRSMHRSLWAKVAHSSSIEGSQMTKNTASGLKSHEHLYSIACNLVYTNAILQTHTIHIMTYAV